MGAFDLPRRRPPPAEGAMKVTTYRYKPVKHQYHTPLTNTMIANLVRDTLMLDHNNKLLAEGTIFYPDTAAKEGWSTTDPILEVVVCGPDVKDLRIKPGALVLIPKRVLGQCPMLFYSGVELPDGDNVDRVYWTNETNVASVIRPEVAAEILKKAIEMSAVDASEQK